jgi:hypothetical protein
MLALKLGANAVHGVPRVIVENARAALLRSVEAHVGALSVADGADERTFWASQGKGKASGALAHAMRLAIMGVTFFNKKDAHGVAKRRDVAHSDAVTRALASPLVRAIIARGRETGYRRLVLDTLPPAAAWPIRWARSAWAAASIRWASRPSQMPRRI